MEKCNLAKLYSTGKNALSHMNYQNPPLCSQKILVKHVAVEKTDSCLEVRRMKIPQEDTRIMNFSQKSSLSLTLKKQNQCASGV